MEWLLRDKNNCEGQGVWSVSKNAWLRCGTAREEAIETCSWVREMAVMQGR